MISQFQSPISLDVSRWIYLHLTLWLLLALFSILQFRAYLLPSRHFALWLICFGIAVVIVSLWLGRSFTKFSWIVLHTFSIVLAFAVFSELECARHQIKGVDSQAFERFPYPYRMHGMYPNVHYSRGVGSISFDVTTNDTGLRGKEPIPRKSPGEYRVLLLGGSAVFGIGSSDDQTVACWLERFLNRSTSEKLKRIRVINGGQPWYNSTQELVFLTTELALYEPDVIVVLDGYNDAFHLLEWGDRPPANEVTTSILEDAMERAGVTRSVSWTDVFQQALKASALFRAAGLRPSSVVYDASAPGAKAWRLRASARAPGQLNSMMHRLLMNWTLMDRLGRAFHCPVIFSLQPTLFTKKNFSSAESAYIERSLYGRDFQTLKGTWRKLDEYLRSQARRLKLSLFRADSAISGRSESMVLDFCHLTPEGNRLEAQAIEQEVAHYLQNAARSNWDGVRYPFSQGDPIWRPSVVEDSRQWN